MTARRWKLRILGFGLAAIAAVFTPSTLWMHADAWWLRVLGSLATVARAGFVGYCVAFVVARPLLSIRGPGEPPMISLGEALRMMFDARHRRDWVAGSHRETGDEGSTAI